MQKINASYESKLIKIEIQIAQHEDLSNTKSILEIKP